MATLQDSSPAIFLSAKDGIIILADFAGQFASLRWLLFARTLEVTEICPVVMPASAAYFAQLVKAFLLLLREEVHAILRPQPQALDI